MIATRLPVAAARIPHVLAAVRSETHQWWQEQTRLPSAEPQRLRALLIAAQRRFHAIMRRHILATMLAQAAYDQLNRLAIAAGQAGAERELATGFGGLEESVILGDLWEVSRERMDITGFVRRHGYHGPSEGELSSASWRADSHLLEALVAAHRELDVSPTDRQRERAAVRAAAQRRILHPIGRLQRLRARAAFGFAARHIPLREVGKAAFLQAIDVARFAATGLGCHLCDEGVLTHPSDIFLLTVQELGDNSPPDQDEIEQRRWLRQAFAPFTLPERWVGDPTPVIRVEPVGIRPGDAIAGVPVSGGVVEGRVRVLSDPASAAAEDFQPGEILVCAFTDPSWTLLMNLAAALVIDVGGALSHGAIVARELGVSTVINTVDGTRLLRTGDRVRVDADAGTVVLLERPGVVAGTH
jgi:pyruvate,water dikinase